MAAGGEDLPHDLLRIIFPVAHWDLIRKYAAQNGLDPYVVAALIAQESTFVSDIRSPVKAVGLTQLMTPTARQYARILNLKWTPAMLTDPEANVRIGLAYFADKIKEFGGVHLALASYNAGERAVRRWMVQYSGVAQDEFIDDIGYPETQQYVKKILGTAEDYRRLYGLDSGPAENSDAVPAVSRAPRPSTKAVSAAPANGTKKKAASAPARKPKRKAPRPAPATAKKKPAAATATK
jgi:soluble lytic murein transglycosylase